MKYQEEDIVKDVKTDILIAMLLNKKPKDLLTG